MGSVMIGCYKEMPIEKGLYGDVFSIQYLGDDYLFDSLEEAIKFVDEIEDGGQGYAF